MEATVERALIRKVDKLGGITLKLIGKGWPDRLCIMHYPHIGFAELKDEKGRLSPHQKEIIRRLNNLGWLAEAVVGKGAIDGFIARLLK